MSRYARQEVLDVIGPQGQAKLKQAKVCIIGCGGLGSIAAPYLAGAGVGHLTLVDGDRIQESNLHRQVFYHTEDRDKSKGDLLAQHINRLNPEVEVTVESCMINKENIASIISDDMVVLECTDHIWTKYLLNDYCHIQRIPMIYGAIHKYDGYVSCFENSSAESIHLRDVFPIPNEDIPTCSEVGVMGTLAGLIGLFQANEAIKYIIGTAKPLIGTMLSYNILSNDQYTMKLVKHYSEDMDALYQRTSYKQMSQCNSFDLSVEVFAENRDNYKLISILEDDEHQDIDNKVVRMPLSSFDTSNLPVNDGRSIVIYCMSGKRSATLVEKLLKEFDASEIYSLKGGLSAWKLYQLES